MSKRANAFSETCVWPHVFQAFLTSLLPLSVLTNPDQQLPPDRVVYSLRSYGLSATKTEGFASLREAALSVIRRGDRGHL
jgi:hypothetical protein